MKSNHQYVVTFEKTYFIEAKNKSEAIETAGDLLRDEFGNDWSVQSFVDLFFVECEQDD